VRAVNDARRAADFAIADRIRLTIGATGRVHAAAHAHREWIAREVLAVALDVVGTIDLDGAARVEVDGEPVALVLARA
jgi:isoleucyl-tRNA synthetase